MELDNFNSLPCVPNVPGTHYFKEVTHTNLQDNILVNSCGSRVTLLFFNHSVGGVSLKEQTPQMLRIPSTFVFSYGKGCCIPRHACGVESPATVCLCLHQSSSSDLWSSGYFQERCSNTGILNKLCTLFGCKETPVLLFSFSVHTFFSLFLNRVKLGKTVVSYLNISFERSDIVI